MIIIQKTCILPEYYPLTRIANPEEILFFDIETTGFSGARNQLYLIGAVWYDQTNWQLIQWFAEQPEDEPALLDAFFSFLKPFRILLHFNGDRFDLPFLSKRCAFHQLSLSFDRITSFDLYRKIKPIQPLLPLEHLKQKNIETFLGLEREDRYSGGELISIYKTYLRTRDPQLYRLLLLHNEEDLKGMPSILPILSYPDFFDGPFVLQNETLEKYETPDETKLFLCLRYKGSVSVPVPIEQQKEDFQLQLSEHTLTLNIPLFEGECKHFYPDYQNYVYLIYEDTAVHKSIGQYVDKTAKKKASARTCYTKSRGIFLPQLSEQFQPVLKRDYSDRIVYTPYQKGLFQDPQNAERYRRELLTLFF